MNEPLNDPALGALEAALAANPPELSPLARNELLYQSAFAAGRHASRCAIRRWQGLSGLLGVLLVVGLVAPLANNMPGDMVQAPDERTPASERLEALEPIERLASDRPPLALDAWQRRGDAEADVAEAIARFQQADPTERSLAIPALAEQVWHDL